MSKKTKNIILMIIIYIISLFLFELIIGVGNFSKVEEICVRNGYNTPFPYFISFVFAGIYHFIFVTAVAIISLFFKRIDKAYKTTLFIFPFFTYLFSLPMMIPACYFATAFHLYGF